MSFDISRINWARCLEVVDPVMAVVYLSVRWGNFFRVGGAPEVKRTTEALRANRLSAFTARALGIWESYCGEYNVDYKVRVKCVMLEVCLQFEQANACKA